MFAIFSFKWLLNTFVFYMGVNSITALKLSAIVPRILNEKEAFISGRFLRLCNSSLFIFDEHFMTLFSVRYLKR